MVIGLDARPSARWTMPTPTDATAPLLAPPASCRTRTHRHPNPSNAQRHRAWSL